LIVYEWALKGMGNLGWIAAFVYVAGAALRLARFNVMLDVADKRWFTGIPSPAAAALVAGFVWIIDYFSIDPVSIRWWAWAVTLFAGLTMVSNVPYYSFKTINLKRSVPFLAIFAFVLVIALVWYQPESCSFGGLRGLRAVRIRRRGVDVVCRAAARKRARCRHFQPELWSPTQARGLTTQAPRTCVGCTFEDLTTRVSWRRLGAPLRAPLFAVIVPRSEATLIARPSCAPRAIVLAGGLLLLLLRPARR
jgi:hypothetical protein